MKNKNFLLLMIAIAVLVTTTFAQPAPDFVAKNGLIGWYPFNSNANDSSGNGNNGYVTGATLTTDRNGKKNSAYDFKNDIDHIALPTVSANNILKYSVTGWFQNTPNNIFDGAIFAQGNACNGVDGLRFFMGMDKLLYWKVEYTSKCSGKGTHQTNWNYTIDGAWHFFAVTFDGEPGLIKVKQFKIYIDNILVTKDSDSTGVSADGNPNIILAPIMNSTNSTTIGNKHIGGNTFKGKIDDIGIWNRILTTSEINNLFNSKIVSVNSALKMQNISLLPNPTQNKITIDLGIIPNLDGYKIKITNALGQQVYHSEITQQEFSIDLSNYVGSGIYFAQIFDGQGSILEIKKIVLL